MTIETTIVTTQIMWPDVVAVTSYLTQTDSIFACGDSVMLFELRLIHLRSPHDHHWTFTSVPKGPSDVDGTSHMCFRR